MASADWIDATEPRLSFNVASGLASAAMLADAGMSAPRVFRADIRAGLDSLLDGRRVLCLPTVPILPTPRDARLGQMRAAVDRIVPLTCIAGLAGLPQVNPPLGWHATIPVGVSLIAWRTSDEHLLALAAAIRPSARTAYPVAAAAQRELVRSAGTAFGGLPHRPTRASGTPFANFPDVAPGGA